MTLARGKCRKLTPPANLTPPELTPPKLLTPPGKPLRHRIRVLIMGISFLAYDAADAVKQSGLAAWGSARHARTSRRYDSE